MQTGLAYWVGSGYLRACVEGASYLSGLLGLFSHCPCRGRDEDHAGMDRAPKGPRALAPLNDEGLTPLSV